MKSSTISKRGAKNVEDLDIPWRFQPASASYYDRETNPEGLMSFATSENSYITEDLTNFVKENVHISAASFTYAACSNGGPLFPELMASHIENYFSPITPVTPSNIITASGVTAVQTMIAFAIGDEGDGVIVSPPVYGRFEFDYGNASRVKIIYADMKGMYNFEPAIVERFEDAFENATKAGIKVRALLIANPSNPLGHCYSRETLIALLAFCQRHNIHLISDEVYALSVFYPPGSTSAPFTSVLSINTDNLIDPNLVQVIFGMSKDFGSAGLKIGSLVSRNKNLIDCCKSLLRFHTSSGPSLDIACAILKQPEFVKKLLKTSHEGLRAGYSLTTSTLKAANIPYYPGGNAGFFVYLDLSRYLNSEFKNAEAEKDQEFALAQYMVDNGVFLHPKEEHSQIAGWYRLVFACWPLPDLKIGLERLVKALKRLESQ